MKFTEIQLSKILSMHESGQLIRYGEINFKLDTNNCVGLGCVNQIAYNSYSVWDAVYNNEKAAGWFDDNYDRKWTSEHFLSQLEKEGLA